MHGTQVDAEGHTFHIRAIAGVESCCYVDGIDIAFDMGCCFHKVASKSNVFITHGHVDHLSAFVTHAARRNLNKMAPARYYVPAHLVRPMQDIIDNVAVMQGDEIKACIVPVHPFEEIHLSSQWMVKAVPTVHRVPSLGYIVYRKLTRLKDEYVGVPGKEIAALRKAGQEVTTTAVSPEIAYTGDTTAQIFEHSWHIGDPEQKQENDFLKVKVLITEVSGSAYLVWYHHVARSANLQTCARRYPPCAFVLNIFRRHTLAMP